MFERYIPECYLKNRGQMRFSTYILRTFCTYNSCFLHKNIPFTRLPMWNLSVVLYGNRYAFEYENPALTGAGFICSTYWNLSVSSLYH